MIMSVYNVFAPPQQGGSQANPERFAFVRDGFSLWAFLFGPLWMLRYRMWLVLLGYVLLAAALGFLLHVLRVSESAAVTVGILLALLVGFESATLRAFTFRRRKWSNVGVIVGDDREAAERRFFDLWVHNGGDMSAVSTVEAPATPAGMTAADIIGLFPSGSAR
jgi:hypothetical protein